MCSNKKKRLKRMTAFLATWLVLLAFAPLFSINVHAADDDDGDSFSLYDRAKLVSKEFGKSVGMDENGKELENPLLLTSSGAPVGTGQSAGVVGFTEGKSGFIFNMEADNKVTVTLDSLKKINVKGIKDGDEPNLAPYAEYGLTLAHLGLDKTSNSIGGFSRFIDKIVYFVYWLASGTPLLMKSIVNILQMLNPFVYLSEFMMRNGGKANTSADFASSGVKLDKDGKAIDGSTENNGNFWSAIYPVITVFGNYINTLQDLSMNVMFPLFVGFGIFSILLLRQSFKSTFGRMIVRLFIMFLGVPLVGSMYTQALDTIKDGAEGQSAYFTRIVYTNYLDFKSWAFNTRLGLPSELTGVIDNKGQLHGKTLDDVTLTLNAYALNQPSLLTDLESIGNPFEDMTNTSSDSKDGKNKNNRAADINSLFAIASSNSDYKVSSSDYEGLVKAEAQRLITKNEDNNKAIRNILTLDQSTISDTSETSPAKSLLATTRSSDTKKALESGGSYYNFDIYNAGALKRKQELYKTAEGAELSVSTARNSLAIPAFSETTNAAYNGSGLTPLGMYNYLNSSFSANIGGGGSGFSGGSIEIYSPQKSSSDFVRKYHHAVVMTGTSVEVGMKYVLICVTFLSLAMLQISVVAAIFKLVISKFASLAGGIVGSTLGSITAFIKMAAGALVTIGVIVASMALYNLYAGILIGLFQWVDEFVKSIVGENNVVGYMIKIVIVLAFAYMGSKSILTISKHLTAIVDEIIQKISNTLQQNWARNAAIGSMASYGGPNADGMNAYAGTGGYGGNGANGKDGDSAFAKGADVLGLGKQARGMESLWETGKRDLEAINKERQARGEAPLETKGFKGLANQASSALKHGTEAHKKKKADKADRKQAKADRKAERKAEREQFVQDSGMKSALGKGAAGLVARGKQGLEDAKSFAKDGPQLQTKSLSAYAKANRIDSEEQSKAFNEQVGRARTAYANDVQAQNNGATEAAYVDEQATRNMPGFDKSTVGEDGLRTELYTDRNGNEATRLVDQYGRTNEEADMVSRLYDTNQELSQLRQTDTSNMSADQKAVHQSRMNTLQNRSNRLTKQLSNAKTVSGRAKYGKEALSGQGLANLNQSMQKTFATKTGDKANNIRTASRSGYASGNNSTQNVHGHTRTDEIKARRANPSSVRSDGLRRGGNNDMIQTKSAQGAPRQIENLYDNQGRSLGDLVAMNNLQAAYDVVNYATEMQDQGVDWRSDKGLMNQFESAQEMIVSTQEQLQSAGYHSSQISQEALSATMGSLEKTVGRTTEYSDHNRGNDRKMQSFINKVEKIESGSNENLRNNNVNQRPTPKSVPRFKNSSPGGRGHKPVRKSKGKKR